MTTPSPLTKMPSYITNEPWNYFSTEPFVSPSKRQLNLAAAGQVQAPEKPSIDTSEELRVKGLIEKVTEQFKAIETALAQPLAAGQVQAPEKPSIDTDEELRIKGFRE